MKDADGKLQEGKIDDLLARTVFYKVGHHGSHNATLRRRSAARGAVTLARLAGDPNGELVSTFTMSWSDDTTGIILSPVALVETLASLVPLPWVSWCGMGAVWRCTAACAACSR